MTQDVNIKKGQVLGRLIAKKDFIVHVRALDPSFSRENVHKFSIDGIRQTEDVIIGHDDITVMDVLPEALQYIFHFGNKDQVSEILEPHVHKSISFINRKFGAVDIEVEPVGTVVEFFKKLHSMDELAINKVEKNGFQGYEAFVCKFLHGWNNFLYGYNGPGAVCLPGNNGIEVLKKSLGAKYDAFMSANIEWFAHEQDKYFGTTRNTILAPLFIDKESFEPCNALTAHMASHGFYVPSEWEKKRVEDLIWAKHVAEAKSFEKEQAASDKKYLEKKGKWWLVKWEGNWADEIDFFARSIMNNDELKRFKEVLKKKAKDSLTLCFGTNESDDWTYGEYLDACSFTEIKGDVNVRKFIYENCTDDCSWSPDNVWLDAISESGK